VAEEGDGVAGKVLTVTTDTIPGYRIVKTLGLVRASRGHNIRRTEKAAEREAMVAAQNRVLDDGGNAIVGFRIAATESLVYVYGTGAVIEPLDTGDVE